MFHTYILNACCFIIIFHHAATELKCWSEFCILALGSSPIASTYGQPSNGKEDFEIVHMCFLRILVVLPEIKEALQICLVLALAWKLLTQTGIRTRSNLSCSCGCNPCFLLFCDR